MYIRYTNNSKKRSQLFIFIFADFSWVEGDMAEVQLQVSNPMPDELKVSQITLITEGVEIESVPMAPSIPAETGSYSVKILIRPTSTGDLKILG